MSLPKTSQPPVPCVLAAYIAAWLTEQLVQLLVAVLDGDTDAGADRHITERRWQEAGEGEAEALGHCDGRIQVPLPPDEDAEFIPAQASRGVLGPQTPFDPGRHRHEHLIAGLVAHVLLTALKLSRSRYSTENGVPRCLSAAITCSMRSTNRTRFGRPVSESCTAKVAQVGAALLQPARHGVGRVPDRPSCCCGSPGRGASHRHRTWRQPVRGKGEAPRTRSPQPLRQDAGDGRTEGRGHQAGDQLDLRAWNDAIASTTSVPFSGAPRSASSAPDSSRWS